MPIAIIIAILSLRRLRPMMNSRRRNSALPSAHGFCATVISTIIRIISGWLLAAVTISLPACNENEPASQSPSAQTAPSAHERGHQNAAAMVDDAARCETGEGVSDLAACKSACQLNHSNSCANWGQLVAEREPERARELYDRACRGGSGIGCELRARLAALEKQSDAEERFATARGYHRVHCSQGYARSCAQLARLYEEGLGGAGDSQAATEFQRRACSLGWQEACSTFKE